MLPRWERRNDRAPMRLICLPHAGGGPQAYRAWLNHRDDLDVQPVGLPGRDGLTRWPLVADMATLVDQFVGPAVAQATDRPAALLGHSMGAAIAAETVAWLGRHRLPSPRLLVVSGYRGDDHHREDAAGQTDDQLVEEMLALGGTEPKLFRDPEMRAYLLSVIRNDMALLQRYRKSYHRLSVPILALGGSEDPEVSAKQLEAWRIRTTGRFERRMLPGDHFYLHRQVARTLEIIMSVVSPDAPDPALDQRLAARLHRLRRG